MNTFVAIVIGLVAYLFFLSGDSFLALLSTVVLLFYLAASGGFHSGSDSRNEPFPDSSERAGDSSKVEKFAERTGDLVNSIGTFFGHLFTWAFKGEKKE